MNRILIILLIATLPSGCVNHYMGLDDLPDAALRPEIGSSVNNTGIENTALWRGEVQAAANVWNTALALCGRMPVFHVTDDPSVPAYPVVLWPHEEWTHEDKLVGLMVSGEVGTGFIHVRNREPRSNLPILIHEMGHALGLSFEDNEDDFRHALPGSDSVMTANVGNLMAPTARDIAALGCS